ncbi:MAG TPA: metal-dependent transcriptional regulator [Anaerolineaceae bacterium]|nr:metal-dependent transcriptional regulator [Anaerolineaceae bacterium]HPN53663.1 metal-dependent transcriptional regulator [Anaerolineaceae bacterium]
MSEEHIEMYLGVIYQLRGQTEDPVPLSKITAAFGYSPMSTHQMIQKLEGMGLLHYQPYRGVFLTPEGEGVAAALLRRHAVWETFLIQLLEVPADEAHAIADRLEHAAPEKITERLAAVVENHQTYLASHSQ